MLHLQKEQDLKDRGMGLTKTLREFFFIFASECLCKKTLQEQLHLSKRFYWQKR